MRAVGLDGTTRLSVRGPGSVFVLHVADLDGDGKPEILTGDRSWKF